MDNPGGDPQPRSAYPPPPPGHPYPGSPGYPPPPLPSSGLSPAAKGCLVATGVVAVLIVVVCLVAVVVFMRAGPAMVRNQMREAHDVTVDCHTDERDRTMAATVTVVNHSSKRSGYRLTVLFDEGRGTGADDNLASVPVTFDEVAPDETLEQEIDTHLPVDGYFECNATSVDRYSLEDH